MTVAPDFYSHSWEQVAKIKDPQLVIQFGDTEQSFKTQVNEGGEYNNLEERRSLFK